jgi:Rrf2 family protein
MKLTVRGEYALRALLVLGQRFGPQVVPVSEVAAAQNIPRRFLEQILTDLKSAGLVESKRGIAGGFRLALPPDEIPLSRVIRHVDGAIAPISCVSQRAYEKCSCPDEATCPLRAVMKEVRDLLVKMMDETTVADLVRRAEQLGAHPIPPLDFVI